MFISNYFLKGVTVVSGLSGDEKKILNLNVQKIESFSYSDNYFFLEKGYFVLEIQMFSGKVWEMRFEKEEDLMSYIKKLEQIFLKSKE